MISFKQLPATISSFSVVVTVVVPAATLVLAPSFSTVTHVFEEFDTELPWISGAFNLPLMMFVVFWLLLLAVQVFVTVKLQPRLWISCAQCLIAVAGGMFFFFCVTVVYYIPFIRLLNDLS